MPRVAYFDVAADDPERALKFYKQVFGWEITRWDGPWEYWRIKTGDPAQPGIDGGLARRDQPGQFITPFVEVASVDDFLARIAAAGGRVIQPKTAIPGVGYMAACKDTEGNSFGLIQADAAAR